MTTATVSPVVERGQARFDLASRLMFAAPDEAKFKDFASIRADAREQRKRSRELETDLRKFLFAHKDGRDYVYVGDYDLRLTNLFYKQVALEAGIPLGTLSRLKADTRVRVLNELWEPKRGGVELPQKLLLETNETSGFDVRCMNGARYERLWDDEVFGEVERWLTASGWTPAYPTFNIDPNTPVADRPKALIRTDRYSFTFFFTEPKFKAGDGFSDQKASGWAQGSAAIAAAQGNAPAPTPGNGDTDGLGGLRKGLMVYNGETGQKSFGWQMFLFRNVCHNFNIWDLQEGRTKRARHTKSVREAFDVFREDCKNLSGELTEFELDHLHKAKRTEFAKDEEAIEKRLCSLGLTKAHAHAASEASKLEINGADTSVWSVVNGITWAAKELANEDDRVELCAQAGHVLNAAMR